MRYRLIEFEHCERALVWAYVCACACINFVVNSKFWNYIGRLVGWMVDFNLNITLCFLRMCFVYVHWITVNMVCDTLIIWKFRLSPGEMKKSFELIISVCVCCFQVNFTQLHRKEKRKFNWIWEILWKMENHWKLSQNKSESEKFILAGKWKVIVHFYGYKFYNAEELKYLFKAIETAQIFVRCNSKKKTPTVLENSFEMRMKLNLQRG